MRCVTVTPTRENDRLVGPPRAITHQGWWVHLSGEVPRACHLDHYFFSLLLCFYLCIVFSVPYTTPLAVHSARSCVWSGAFFDFFFQDRREFYFKIIFFLVLFQNNRITVPRLRVSVRSKYESKTILRHLE